MVQLWSNDIDWLHTICRVEQYERELKRFDALDTVLEEGLDAGQIEGEITFGEARHFAQVEFDMKILETEARRKVAVERW